MYQTGLRGPIHMARPAMITPVSAQPARKGPARAAGDDEQRGDNPVGMRGADEHQDSCLREEAQPDPAPKPAARSGHDKRSREQEGEGIENGETARPDDTGESAARRVVEAEQDPSGPKRRDVNRRAAER